MSGVPGRRFTWMRNRSPILCSIERTTFSGRVSFDRIAAITSLRFCLLKTSVIPVLAVSESVPDPVLTPCDPAQLVGSEAELAPILKVICIKVFGLFTSFPNPKM